MSQKLQPMLTKAQQGKIHQLQLEVEALWSQVQNKNNLQSDSHIEVTEAERSIATRDCQLHSV